MKDSTYLTSVLEIVDLLSRNQSENPIHFPMHPDGLHYYDFTNPEVSFLQTVKENKEGYRLQSRTARWTDGHVERDVERDVRIMRTRIMRTG
jgi:hypothetical protein